MVHKAVSISHDTANAAFQDMPYNSSHSPAAGSASKLLHACLDGVAVDFYSSCWPRHPIYSGTTGGSLSSTGICRATLPHHLDQTPMYHFCTYFDRNYLLRGLTLYRSLTATGCEFTLSVLALDKETEQILVELELPNLETIPLVTLEAWEPGLEIARNNRSLIEYYFTLSPLLPLYILKHAPQTSIITYLDADLYFYGSPEPIFTELGDRSILVIEHRYPDHLRDNERFGLFNVQYESFRNDAQGLACLERWRDQCLEWCYDRDETTRYADQKYLNEWPELYGDSLVVLQHRGAGVAPWNWGKYPLELRHNELYVGSDLLIFYHFHGVKIFHPCFISNGLADWGMMPYRPRRWLYAGYLRHLRATRSWLRNQHGVALPLKDRFIRGKGINMATLREIARKAWVQGMLVC